MPQYFDDEIPYFGRKSSKDLKIYRNSKQRIAPDCVMKCMQDVGTGFGEYFTSDGALNTNFLQSDDRFKKPLLTASKLFFDRFHIPYSIKKKKNWELVDETKRNITSIQDDRLSIMVVKINSICLYQSERFDNTLDYVPVDEIHLVDSRNREIHKKTKNLFYGEIFYPHKFIRENAPPNIWYKKFIKKNHPPRPIINLWHSFSLYKIILVLKELVSKYSNRWLNMDKKWIAKYKDNQKNAVERRERKDRYSRRNMKYKDNKKNRMKKKGKDCQSHRNKKFFTSKCQEYANELYNEEIQPLEREISEVLPTSCRSQFYISDFLVGIPIDRLSKSNSKSKRQRNGKISKIRSEEFEQWFASSPAYELHKENDIVDESQVTDSKEKNVFSYESLPLYNIFLNQREAEFIKRQLLPNTQPVLNVIPICYITDFNWQNNTHLVLPEFLENFYGSIIIQPILYARNNEFLRIILNAFVSEYDKFNESEDKSSLLVPRSSFEKFLPRTVQLPSYDSSSVCCVFLQEMFPNKYEDQQDELCSSTSYDVDSYCSICGENDKYGFALQCKHYFCADCWGQYSVERISLARVPVLCPKTFCNEKLSLGQMRIFLSNKICQWYKNLLFNRGMMRREWTYCRKCSKILHIPESSKMEKTCGICKCGSSVCLLCEREVHIPLSCNEYEPYANVVTANENNLLQLNVDNVSVAKCPNCGAFCERNGGCEHIMCICNFDFCYQCGDAWSNQPHYMCKTKLEKVNLYDVPIEINDKIPLHVVEECFKYRRSDKISLLTRRLFKIFRSDYNMFFDVRSTFFAVTSFMEMLLLKIHYTKSYLKMWRKRNKADNKVNSSSIKLRILLKSKNRLRFSFNLFCTAIDAQNRMRIIRSKMLLDNTLQACISEII